MMMMMMMMMMIIIIIIIIFIMFAFVSIRAFHQRTSLTPLFRPGVWEHCCRAFFV